MTTIEKITGDEIGKAEGLLSPESRDEDDFYDGHQRVKLSYLQGLERRNRDQVQAINLIYEAVRTLKERVDQLEEQWRNHEQKSDSAETPRTAKARGSSTGTGKGKTGGKS